MNAHLMLIAYGCMVVGLIVFVLGSAFSWHSRGRAQGIRFSPLPMTAGISLMVIGLLIAMLAHAGSR